MIAEQHKDLETSTESTRRFPKKLSKVIAKAAISHAPTVVLSSKIESFIQRSVTLREPLIIGRHNSSKTVPSSENGYFDNKVLSRTHAQIYCENGKIYIQDMKSSNGTFLNGKRLSPEGQQSEPVEVKDGDQIDFGVDILKEDGASTLYEKIATTLNIIDPFKIPDNDSVVPDVSSNKKQEFSNVNSDLQKVFTQGKDLREIKESLGEIQSLITNEALQTPPAQKNEERDKERAIEIETLKTKLQELQTKIASDSQKILILKEENSKLVKKSEELSVDNLKLQGQLDLKTRDAKIAVQNIDDLHIENESLRKKISELNSQVESLEIKIKQGGNSLNSVSGLGFISVITIGLGMYVFFLLQQQ